MVPPSGTSKPAMRRNRVVLPEPEGPSIVKNSPTMYVEVDVVDRDVRRETFGDAAQRDALFGRHGDVAGGSVVDHVVPLALRRGRVIRSASFSTYLSRFAGANTRTKS